MPLTLPALTCDRPYLPFTIQSPPLPCPFGHWDLREPVPPLEDYRASVTRQHHLSLSTLRLLHVLFAELH